MEDPSLGCMNVSNRYDCQHPITQCLKPGDELSLYIVDFQIFYTCPTSGVDLSEKTSTISNLQVFDYVPQRKSVYISARNEVSI